MTKILIKKLKEILTYPIIENEPDKVVISKKEIKDIIKYLKRIEKLPFRSY